jgi:hypothetical protein
MGNESKIASGNEYELIEFVPAIILYPSFAVPAVLTKNDVLEILLVGKSGFPITKENVKHQLKIDPTFASKKEYHSYSLPLDDNDITIEEKTFPISDIIFQTKNKKFIGILDERIKNKISASESASMGIPESLGVLKKGNYDLVYSVQIKNNGLFYAKEKKPERGVFNLIWLLYKIDSESYFNLSIASKTQCSNDTIPLNHFESPGKKGVPQIVPNDIYSNIMHAIMDDLNKNEIGKTEKSWWKYCFKNGDPSLSNFDPLNPIQEFHPVFYFENLDAPNFAHLADIHLSARQHLFSQSQARVINCPQALDISPKIKELVNCSKDNFKSILNQCGESDDIDIILISGDLIDYLQSLFIRFNSDWKLIDIWMLVNSSKDDSKNFRFYKFGVDYITLFSIMLEFYREFQKPIFIIRGNHDAYREPYGIAPRVGNQKDLLRANEGIPADHNLTTFESLLMFGQSYHEYNERFNKKEWIWYHTILTPFSDFVIQLPKHYLVGFGWGDDEDIIGITSGHLPRCDDAISQKQIDLFNLALKYKASRELILMTHFTFVSYKDNIPSNSSEEGIVKCDYIFDHDSFDWGTFESNREVFYRTHLVENRGTDIQLVLSGHSHRRGLYSMVRLEKKSSTHSDKDGNIYEKNSYAVITKCHDFDDFNNNKINPSYKYPVILVSDSSGPIPRRNYSGEFNGWGSDVPSGTKINYDLNGKINSISPIKSKTVKSKPRFVVAVDYYDIIEKKDVIKKFQFDFLPEREAERKSYNFLLELDSNIASLAFIDKIFLYAFDSKLWNKIEMRYSDKRWLIFEKELFFKKFVDQNNKDYKVFVALKFGTDDEILNNQYNFNSYWCFPVSITSNESYGIKTYKIKRDKSDSEYPDFEWYSKYFNV